MNIEITIHRAAITIPKLYQKLEVFAPIIGILVVSVVRCQWSATTEFQALN